MGINALKMLKYKNEYEQFMNRHPKLSVFLEAVSREGIQTGTVIEARVTMPDGKDYVSNIKLTDQDVKLIQDLKSDGLGGN
ncbi:hypothetical protein INP51_00305 [Blautia liquoris]|uniref:Uncharacterized protein n=1 Tax=Blautia liquoris TaxID=2779518 RepID=A0A7M2RJD3_9FIRM|nr:hypothetical protein [Blautia liquoris]QOV19462.1 hypothetical protein INP51_00305 [Blautia liquoris]